jgi:glycoside/pentoside/hexuronide:cation symporter, GPH family
MSLSRLERFFYAFPQLPHAMVIVPVINMIPAYWADQKALPLAAVGLVIMLTRLTDVVTDPLVGVWSDRAHSRWGRRKPFIIAGLPLMIAGVWMVFLPPDSAGLIWLFAGLFTMYLGFTLVDIPYVSWGAELEQDYDARSQIAAQRQAMGTIGTLITLSFPLIVQQMGYIGPEAAIVAMAFFFIVMQPSTFLLALWRVNEPAIESSRHAELPFRHTLRLMRSNGNFMRLLIAVFCMIAGIVGAGTLHLLTLAHAIGQPEIFPVMLFCQNVLGLIAIPLWLLLARRIGKHLALLGAGIWNAFFFSLTFLFGPGQGVAFAAMVTISGAALAAVLFLGNAMIPDNVDADSDRGGGQTTGIYAAALAMTTKFGVAIGVVLATAIPAAFGFQPSDGQHSAAALFGLRATYAFIGVALTIPAAIALLGYRRAGS